MILLTIPYAPGDLDPGRTYTHVQVRRYQIDRALIEMETCLGYLVAGVFTEGRCPACRHTVRDRQLAPPRDGANHTRCSDLLAVSGTAGTSAALSLQNGLAQHLIDQGIYPGSVV